MRKIMISPAPRVGLHVLVTDQMEKDFRRCQRLAAKEGDGPDCDVCAWRDLVLDNGSQSIAACTLPKIRRMMEGKT